MKTIWTLQENDTIYCVSVGLETYEYKVHNPYLYQTFFVRMSNQDDTAKSWYTELKPKQIEKDESVLTNEQDVLWSTNFRVGWFYFCNKEDRDEYIQQRKQEVGWQD